jgi:hypothetical protein
LAHLLVPLRLRQTHAIAAVFIQCAPIDSDLI